jgi:hypothetical protein
MRFFKLKREFNWKYVFGEILLIFIGINLAIWFNNWNTSQIIATPNTVNELKIKYPDFYRVLDSIPLKNGLFKYQGGTHILLEIPILNEIAWDTTKTLSILNEFDYECLYDLESMYSLQRLVQKEINKAADALQKRELTDLMNILGFLNQLNSQLSQNYKNVLENIENCS